MQGTTNMELETMETDCKGLNPDSATYGLCNPGQIP